MPGARLVEPNPLRMASGHDRMKQAPYILDEVSRAPVLEAIKEVCVHRGWTLLAAHVRTNHVHVLVEAENPPERIMNTFKSYASEI